MPVFWVGSYEYGTRRLRAETQGRVQLLRLTLPDRRWLNDRLAELVPPIELGGTAGWTSKPVSFASSVTVQALVQVEMESELGDVFHVHSFEEEALWRYFRKSPAAVSLRVRRLSRLREPIRVHRDARGGRISMRCSVFFGAAGVFDSAQFFDGRPVHRVWQEVDEGAYGHEIPVILVVEPWAKLLLAGKVQTIPLLVTKWVCSNLDQMPPGDDAETFKGKCRLVIGKDEHLHGQEHELPQFTRNVAQRIADKLKYWSSDIISAAMDNEAQSQRKDQLKYNIRMLESFQDAESSLKHEMAQGGRQQLATRKLIKGLRLAVSLRDRSRLDHVISRSLTLLVGGHNVIR